MTILNQNNCLILVIDIQEKLVNAVFNKEKLIKNSVAVAKSGKLLEIPIFITEQYPKGLGATIEGISGDKYYEKTCFNALEDKNILSELENSNRNQILVMGIETHICVHQTVDSLINSGFDVTVINDACGSRFEDNHLGGLDCMKTDGAHIKSTEMVLFELLKGAKHPKFKEIQSLIK